MKPKKSEEGHWVDLRELGETGEKFIEKYLMFVPGMAGKNFAVIKRAGVLN